MADRSTTNVDQWKVLQDYELPNGSKIEQGTNGVNYWNDFQRYVFIDSNDLMQVLPLTLLLKNPETFKLEWFDAKTT